jgi:hypothetical protein
MDNSKQIYMMKLQQEAKSKSIGLSKQAAPSIFSPSHQSVQKYGKYATFQLHSHVHHLNFDLLHTD